MKATEKALRDLEARLGYHFGDARGVAAALTHASAIEASEPRVAERLELLGDAVAGLVMADLLFEHYPHHSEGQLSKFRAALVSTASFAAKARELRLNESLTLGKGEEKTGGREKSSILAAVYEAVLGAIFLDGGYGVVRGIVERHFHEAIGTIGTAVSTDPKTELQEICQKLYHATPTYRVIAQSGPDHARRYIVHVELKDAVLAHGEGPSKRAAEQDGARRALQGSQLQSKAKNSATV